MTRCTILSFEMMAVELERSFWCVTCLNLVPWCSILCHKIHARICPSQLTFLVNWKGPSCVTYLNLVPWCSLLCHKIHAWICPSLSLPKPFLIATRKLLSYILVCLLSFTAERFGSHIKYKMIVRKKKSSPKVFLTQNL